MKQYLRSTVVAAFAAGLATGTLAIGAAAIIHTAGSDRLHDCQLPVIRYTSVEVTE